MASMLILFGCALLGYLQMKPDKSTRDLALVFSPSKSLTEIVVALSDLPVKLVRTGVTDFIVIVRTHSPAAFEELSQKNDFLMLDAVTGGGCVFLDRKIADKRTSNERTRPT